jgi:hypothetical protein
MTKLKAVGVPPDLIPAFEVAEEKIKGVFDTIKPYPEKGGQKSVERGSCGPGRVK